MKPFKKELPFTIHLDKVTDDNSVTCDQVLRNLPEKRLVCTGLWQQKPVLVKLFLDPHRAQRHWQREKSGVEALRDAEILTPELLFSGQLDNGTPVLLFKFLDDVQTALDRWSQLTTPEEKKTLLLQLVEVVSALHAAGLVQEDLHLGNFLLSEQKMYAIDGDAVTLRDQGSPLNLNLSSLNLALLFAQLFPSEDFLFEDAIVHYAQIRGLDRFQLTDKLKEDLPQVRRRRRLKYVTKSYRNCTEFVRSDGNGQVSIFRRDQQGDVLTRLLLDPDGFMRDGEVLKDGNTCTVVRIVASDCDWVIKRYNIKNPLHALSRCFRPTRAWTSWGNAHRLKISGIATPEAIAVIEKRFGPFRSTGYYVCAFQEGSLASDFFIDDATKGSLCNAAAQNVVRLFSLFRKLGIHHGDCKATNFLVVDDDLSVLDLDAMCEPLSPTRFNKLFQVDRARFLRNWQSHPKLQKWFDEHLPH